MTLTQTKTPQTKPICACCHNRLENNGLCVPCAAHHAELLNFVGVLTRKLEAVMDGSEDFSALDVEEFRDAGCALLGEGGE